MTSRASRDTLIRRSWYDRVQQVFDVLGPQVTCYLIDFITIAYTIVMGCYAYGRLFLGVESFLLFPWWLLVLIAAEAALLWETFGVSVGMQATRLKLLSDHEEPGVGVGRRLLRFGWIHATVLGILGAPLAFFDRQQRTAADRLSHSRLHRSEEPTEARKPWYATSAGLGTAVLLVLTLVTAVYLTEFNLRRLFTQAGRASIILDGLFHPDFSGFGEDIGLLVETIFMALMATLFGVIVAVPLSFLAARNLSTSLVGRAIYTIVRSIMSITRSVEPIIWAVIFVLWVRLGTFPGMLALWIHSIADLTKLYSERLESIDEGPVEAIRSTGATKLQIILFGIIPQILNPYLSFTLYRWDINVRMSVVIGMVAGAGLGQKLFLSIRYWKFKTAAPLLLLVVVTVWVIDYLSSRLRTRLETGAAGKKTSTTES